MITKDTVIVSDKAQELFDLLLPVYRNLEDLVIGTMGHCETDEQRQKLINAVKSGLTDWTKIMFFCWDEIDPENIEKEMKKW